MTRFHDDYPSAREAFLAASAAAGFDHVPLPLDVRGPSGEELAIDVAIKAAGAPRRVVAISSGTHGVEGYFGNAVQLSLLSDALHAFTPSAGEAVVLVHAVNPWGMAHKRRVNEDGVDLNRNFRLDGEAFAGAPAGYRALDPLLNPASPPGGVDLFLPRIAAQLARMGFRAIKDAVASGQYDHPRGLFFGGEGPTTSQRLLAEHLPRLLGGAERVVHLDLHTGSGRWGTYALAVDLPDAARVAQLRAEFGDPVQGLDASGVLYQIHGALGPWLQERMPAVRYDTMLAEFGTWNVVRVLSELRWENRVFHHAGDDPALRAEGAARLMEVFCPSDAAWRRSCVAQARQVVGQAFAAAWGGHHSLLA